jgi:hypothetical protein
MLPTFSACPSMGLKSAVVALQNWVFQMELDY